MGGSPEEGAGKNICWVGGLLTSMEVLKVCFIFISLRQGLTMYPGWPRDSLVGQAGLDLTETHPPLLPECGD